MTCPSCAAEAPKGARFCPACAAPLAAASGSPAPEDATELAPAAGFPTPSSGSGSPPSSTPGSGAGGERFVPGALLAGRYRVVGLLGQGGMGEVYRADDLKLGQPVALKFLPQAVAADDEWLSRFLTEVRVARQISNPHVCRVYDVGEAEGHHFLSMEYIDGEDLASLLRRIGRLPQDKAVQIARQVCTGLAAAHEQGILHRDLKPANVMIDGRGNAKITDFGLAGLAESFTREDAFSGTPAYMAPEQLAGREVTRRSDIYALGLVLYQLFSGKPAFEGKSVAEISRLHQETSPTTPSSFVEGFDPTVERVILRCLEKEPGQRPASALAVSAALPGGDPLAAALAAGETPSPEMVAAAGAEGRLESRAALALLGAFVLLTVAFVLLAARYQISAVIPLDKPRDVLIDRARELIESLGSDRDQVADSAFRFGYDGDLLRYLKRPHRSGDSWQLLRGGRPAALFFWYRESPRLMAPELGFSTRVRQDDPPLLVSGMESVVLDTRGRLIEYARVPPQLEDGGASSGAESPAPDWEVLFGAAGLEIASFTPASSVWVPRFHSDRRAAWVGEVPELPGTEVRVEAASYRGRPTSFQLLGPWSRAERQVDIVRTAGWMANQAASVVLIVLVLMAGIWAARRNLRAGRGDRRGASRLALSMFGIQLLVWLLESHHTGQAGDEFGMLVRATGLALFVSAALWLLYIGLEPFVRRYTPEGIISWSRLLAGRWQDPLVGRDFVLGAVVGTGLTVIGLSAIPLIRWIEKTPLLPSVVWTDPLLGSRWTASSLLEAIPNATFGAMFLVFLWFLLCWILRRRELAAVVLLGLVTFSQVAQDTFSFVGLALSLGMALLVLVVLMRVGLLCLIVSNIFGAVLANLPISLELSSWYALGSWVVLIVVATAVLYAWKLALGGRPLFPEARPAGLARPGSSGR